MGFPARARTGESGMELIFDGMDPASIKPQVVQEGITKQYLDGQWEYMRLGDHRMVKPHSPDKYNLLVEYLLGKGYTLNQRCFFGGVTSRKIRIDGTQYCEYNGRITVEDANYPICQEGQ